MGRRKRGGMVRSRKRARTSKEDGNVAAGDGRITAGGETSGQSRAPSWA